MITIKNIFLLSYLLLTTISFRAHCFDYFVKSNGKKVIITKKQEELSSITKAVLECKKMHSRICSLKEIKHFCKEEDSTDQSLEWAYDSDLKRYSAVSCFPGGVGAIRVNKKEKYVYRCCKDKK